MDGSSILAASVITSNVRFKTNDVARKAFFSLHYKLDCWRISQVRNMGKLEADGPISDNAWEQLKKGVIPRSRNGLTARGPARLAVSSSSVSRPRTDVEC